MAFCPNCGSQVAGSFCPNCGNPMGTAGPGSTPGSGFESPALNAGGLTENVAGALCYLVGFITGIIFLVLAPYNQNKFVRFHAFQSIFLNIAWFVVTIAFGMLGVLTHGILALFLPLLYLAGFLLWLYMMYTAFNSKKIKLPVIGDLAEKQS
ncbi:MAG TPA: hypothetical protein VK604_08695 [Bryobacteraceae bacterium]|nr:hypothetical protein [Bryobacteraceae bacterium]